MSVSCVDHMLGHTVDSSVEIWISQTYPHASVQVANLHNHRYLLLRQQNYVSTRFDEHVVIVLLTLRKCRITF